MEIIDNKAVKFLVRNPDRITSVIPKSKYIGEVEPGVHEIVVHFGLEEAQVLKNLKIKGVRSPIAFTYDWPGIYKPFAHQRVMAEFLTLHPRAFNLSEMGVGKSAAALWAADWLMEQGIVRSALVLTPLQTGLWHGLMRQAARVIAGVDIDAPSERRRAPAAFF